MFSNEMRNNTQHGLLENQDIFNSKVSFHLY